MQDQFTSYLNHERVMTAEKKTLVTSNHYKALDWRDRPPEVKQKIKKVWDGIKNKDPSNWREHGRRGDYCLLNTSTCALIKKVIKQREKGILRIRYRCWRIWI
jgi:hypothetical protein